MKDIFNKENWNSGAGGRMLVYNGRPLVRDIDRSAIAAFIRKQGALCARWTFDFDSAKPGPWYRLVCDIKNYDIEKVESKSARKCIRRCLKACDIRKVDYIWLGKNGYETYIEACNRYSGFKPMSRDVFREDMKLLGEESGREAFGVFNEGKIIAYATVRIRGDIVSIYGSKFNPAYSKVYPMYGLHYEIARCYLNQPQLKEIDSGTRALLHETDIADFLLRLGWRKSYCRLGMYTVPGLRMVLFIAGLSRFLWKRFLPLRHVEQLDSLLLAEKISKATVKR